MATVSVPRVVSPYPMCIDFGGAALVPSRIPVRMRDDLDPHAPPAEYSDGRISWSGYPTREARDTARAQREAEQEATRIAEEANRERRKREDAARAESARRERVRDCAGHEIAATSDARGYTGSVAVYPYTYENRAAHGAVEFVDTCRCGARRRRLSNGRHQELGPWR